MNENKCSICSSEIPLERIDALKNLNISSNNFLCITCSSNNNKTYKALYNNEGSNILLVSGLGSYGIEKDYIAEEEIDEI